MNKINKLCLIIHALSPGGMERVMSQLASYFSQKEQVETHLILYGIKRDIFYPIPETVIIHRPGFEFVNSRRKWHTCKTIFFLRKTIQTIQPDSILSFGEVWNNLVLLTLWGIQYPVFVSDRSRPGKDLGPLHNRLKNRLYPKAKGLISQTGKAREIAEMEKRNSNIQVIGNPIRNIAPDPLIVKENIVLTVGRLIKTKNFDQLIRMFVHINAPGWKLVIVGGDAQKQNLMIELQQLVRQLGATGRITLAGNQSDVDSYYLKSKVFAFTSSSEGFPNVVGEAMSSGLPVVSFDCVAGPSDMICDGEDGFLTPVFDYEMFEVKLRRLMHDENLREQFGSKARESIKRFAVDSIGEQFYSFMINKVQNI